jgi:hypothetical protein
MSILPCDVPRGTGGRADRGGLAPVFRPKIGAETDDPIHHLSLW